MFCNKLIQFNLENKKADHSTGTSHCNATKNMRSNHASIINYPIGKKKTKTNIKMTIKSYSNPSKDCH